MSKLIDADLLSGEPEWYGGGIANNCNLKSVNFTFFQMSVLWRQPLIRSCWNMCSFASGPSICLSPTHVPFATSSLDALLSLSLRKAIDQINWQLDSALNTLLVRIGMQDATWFPISNKRVLATLTVSNLDADGLYCSCNWSCSGDYKDLS